MTQIQITSIKRELTGYVGATYKMSFTLPAVYGTGVNPIDGLSKIVASYAGNYGIEVIPVTGTVITLNETISPDTSFNLAQAKTFLQARYTAVRNLLDSLSLSTYDNMTGLSFDGSVWAATSLITDIPLINNNQATLSVTATGAAAAAVTLTLPAVIGLFHNISYLSITAYTTVARTGTATPVIVTTSNLSGSPAFTFASAAPIGTTDIKSFDFPQPVKSLVANTATTIICPATASIIWRINIFYSTTP